MLQAEKEGLKLPAAIGLYSPLVDATFTGDSFYTMRDRSPRIYLDDGLRSLMNLYVGKADPKDPLISVINGIYQKTFPPTRVATGGRDALFSDYERIVDHLKDAEVDSELWSFPSMWHGFQQDDIKTADKCSKRMAAFFNDSLRDNDCLVQ